MKQRMIVIISIVLVAFSSSFSGNNKPSEKPISIASSKLQEIFEIAKNTSKERYNTEYNVLIDFRNSYRKAYDEAIAPNYVETPSRISFITAYEHNEQRISEMESKRTLLLLRNEMSYLISLPEDLRNSLSKSDSSAFYNRIDLLTQLTSGLD